MSEDCNRCEYCPNQAVIVVHEYLIKKTLCMTCAEHYANELRCRLANMTRAIRMMKNSSTREIIVELMVDHVEPQTS